MKLELVPLNLCRERQGEGKCVGVGLQVLTKTVCSLTFNLQHHWTRSLWRCCQTIECLHPCTPGTVFLEESGELWFSSIFHPCQSLFNIRFAVFFWVWSHKCLWGRSVHLPSYYFVVPLELAKSKETSTVQFEHHSPAETQMAGVLENNIDKQ